jgi:hypothetical protein
MALRFSPGVAGRALMIHAMSFRIVYEIAATGRAEIPPVQSTDLPSLNARYRVPRS